MSDPDQPDDRKVTEEDAVVQTANGERYRASELSKGGYPEDSGERSSRLLDLVKGLFRK